MKNIKPIIPVILILVGLGVGFFGGYEYRNYRLTQTRGGFMIGNGTNGTRFVGGRQGGQGGMMGRGLVVGSIISNDSSSITVKLPDGSTKIVLLGSSTAYSNTISAAQSDLKTGSSVAVFGTTNSDGSVVAATVQINPAFGRPQATPAAQ